MSLETHATPQVDVVIPVYRDLKQTRRCIESVLAYAQATPFELVLIDDATPEPELARYLNSLAGRDGVTLLRNSGNLGFVWTVNRGMALHAERDVVLLNSDTEVANNWLDRLRACVRGMPDIGTATPFSNNATICSYPVFCADNPMPPGIGLVELDGLFASANAGQFVDIPTAVGFCMYIRRACLDRIGLFDAERFGRGYGEENDFCRRAAGAGWRNVLCADTFVFHAGGVSFQDERASLMVNAAAVMRELHPDYDALVGHCIAEDAPAKYRHAVDIARASARMGLGPLSDAAGASGTVAVRLHVVHDFGGGVMHWLRDFCRADEAGINLVLIPFTTSHDVSEGLLLYGGDSASEPLGFWRFSSPIQVIAETHPEYRGVIDGIVREYGVSAVLVSSLIGHALDALDTGLSTLVIQHDFFPLCPAINLNFEGVCRHCDDARLRQCTADNATFNPFPRFPVSGRENVRTRYLELVIRNTTVVVVPDESVRRHLLEVFPRLGEAMFVTIPHGSSTTLARIGTYGSEPGHRLRILVPGKLPLHKGMRLLHEALPQLLEFAEVYLVGANEFGELFQDFPGVHVVDDYEIEALSDIVAAINPDIGLLMSIVPETFSYTLSELHQMGIPPVATRLGAFATRIQPGETGYLFEPGVAAMLACLRAIHSDRESLRAVRSRLQTLPMRTARQMVAEYLCLLPAGDAVWEMAVARPNASSDAAMQSAIRLSRHWKEIDSMRLRLDLKAERMRELSLRITSLQEDLQACEKAEGRLEQALRESAHVVATREAQLGAVYSSTSWAVSSPVRWVGKGLRRVRFLLRLLGRPAKLPSLAIGVYVAWRQNGVRGARQVLVKAILLAPTSSTVTETVAALGSDAPPEDDTASLTDWRQDVFQHYRQSFTFEARKAIHARIASMSAPPLISVLVTTYNSSESMLREMLDSVRRQWYPHWELCIADDGSDLPRVRAVLEEYAALDRRIELSFSARNHGVSHAGNRALEMASGDFVVLLDQCDMLEEMALFRVAETVSEDAPDMLYSDEVKVSEDGTKVLDFLFQPAFSPEYLRSHPYIVHLVGFNSNLLRRIGGFDETLRVCQGYDLILRASEQSKRIVHIPEILYRWRIHASSAGHKMIGQVMDTSRAILQRHLLRCGETGEVHDGPSFNYFDVRYPLSPVLKVAIVIPTKNHADLVHACIESIARTVGDPIYEIVLVDHESDDPASLTYFESIRSRVTLLRYSGPFNFSAINNWAVSQLDGSHTHYLFCNNDIEAIEPGWLERMLELGQKPDVGIVGAKLYYPDGKTIQHAGVVVACCGVAENLGRFRVTSDNPLDPGYMGTLICNREVSAVTAACMLIHRTVFKAVGGFDESIAVGYGDVDICLKVGKQGYRTMFCAHAELLHHESYTRGLSAEDPHPEDSQNFVAKWPMIFANGDPYFNPNFSHYSPNWQVREPLVFKLDIQRRLYEAPIAD